MPETPSPEGSKLPEGAGSPDALDVYWRPGCGYCGRLFRTLERAGVVVRRFNIWEDDDALGFVRAHNRGNETVPTVALAGHVVTNPTPDALVEEIRAEHPELLGAPPAKVGRWSQWHR